MIFEEIGKKSKSSIFVGHKGIIKASEVNIQRPFITQCVQILFFSSQLYYSILQTSCVSSLEAKLCLGAWQKDRDVCKYAYFVVLCIGPFEQPYAQKKFL
jgi:hypothetical protein